MHYDTVSRAVEERVGSSSFNFLTKSRLEEKVCFFSYLLCRYVIDDALQVCKAVPSLCIHIYLARFDFCFFVVNIHPLPYNTMWIRRLVNTSISKSR